ncbi:MAG TPA: response regulator, partial [Planctomycetota bacterium]|nr:response regulator [Planctomycetota bacterium]
EWELLFLEGGEAALAELAVRAADVVVTDMRMPGMDGAQLLARVAAEHPRVARLVLSGQAEPERQLAARACCHLYLVKPCPAEQLEAAIRQSLEVRAALDTLKWAEGQRLWNSSPMDEPTTALLFAHLAGEGQAETAADSVAELLESDRRLAVALGLVLGERTPTSSALRAGRGARPLVALLLAIRLRERVAGPDDGSTALLAAGAAAAGSGAGPDPSLAPALHAATAVLLDLPGPPGRSPGRRAALEFLLPIWGFPEAVIALAARSPARPPADRPHLMPSPRR